MAVVSRLVFGRSDCAIAKANPLLSGRALDRRLQRHWWFRLAAKGEEAHGTHVGRAGRIALFHSLLEEPIEFIWPNGETFDIGCALAWWVRRANRRDLPLWMRQAQCSNRRQRRHRLCGEQFLAIAIRPVSYDSAGEQLFPGPKLLVDELIAAPSAPPRPFARVA
jgi:hypothetical protein